MEKKRFIPFDAETFLMIEDVTGTRTGSYRERKLL